jgi:branched-chain amino acid transport system substrate-binding protein
LIVAGAVGAALVAAVVALAVSSGSGGAKKSAASVPTVDTTPSTGSAAPPAPAAPPIQGNVLTVYASAPLQGGSGQQGQAIENGAQLALDSVGGSVGAYTIDYKPLDDSLAVTGAADEGQAAKNARAAVQDQTAIGYLGDYNSGISKVTIPLLNAAGIAQISPSNTYDGLTTPVGAEPGEPAKYYPTGQRTYARIVPNDTVQARALVLAMKGDGCTSIHVWNSGSTYSAALAAGIVTDAKQRGMTVEGNDRYRPTAASYRGLAAQVHSACFVSTGEIEQNANAGLKDVARANPQVRIYESDGDCINASADPSRGVPPSIAGRFKCTIATLDPNALGPEGKRVTAEYAAKFGEPSPDPYALYGYESMALLLDAIKRAAASNGAVSREGVVHALFQTKNRSSILGTYSIDHNGDTTLADYGLYKVVSGKLTFDHVVNTLAG